MRWKDETSERPLVFDMLYAQEIIHNAYIENYINWNTYKKALARVKTNMNGSWMLEQKGNEDGKRIALPIFR